MLFREENERESTYRVMMPMMQLVEMRIAQYADIHRVWHDELHKGAAE